MAIAAVPDYLRGQDFNSASPGLRFGMYFQGWTPDWEKYVPDRKKKELLVLESVCTLTPNDKSIMDALFKRQQQAFSTVDGGSNALILDAQAVAPFTTGLGNEHPLENGFAFLNPYGLPYLPGSGVKGVLRQAARELASGDWGDACGWNAEKVYPLTIDGKPALDKNKAPILLSMLDVLFGRETKDGDSRHLRGALVFWDVIPQLHGNRLAVEIMTPHYSHYYQQKSDSKSGSSITPHDSGQPNPISFLTVPPGSGFTFRVQCDRALLQRSAPQLAQEERWKPLLQAAFEHAFGWLGFGAKTAVGYGAMREAERKEPPRGTELTPEEQIEKFRQAFTKEKTSRRPYRAGQQFDNLRNTFIETAMTWTEPRSRADAVDLLKETWKWGITKKGKERMKEVLAQFEDVKE